MSSLKKFEEDHHSVRSKETISKLLIAFADALNSMDANEFDLLIQGKAKLRIAKEQKIGKKSSSDLFIDEAVSDLAQKLKVAESREVAANLLADIKQPRKRAFLLLLAKACGVRLDSKDSITRIEQKLVENVVGTRLDSEAIRKVAF